GQNPAQFRAASAAGGQIGIKAEPDGRHAQAHRHIFGLEKLVEALPVETGAGKYQLRPVHWRRVWGSPTASVKQPYDRPPPVTRREWDCVAERDPKGVQHR